MLARGSFIIISKSKKEIGLTVIQDILAKWRKELLKRFFEADKSDSDKFSDMIDWVLSISWKSDGLLWLPNW